MKAFLATVLSVIAAGVLLIAYGLLAPPASAAPQVVFDPQTGMYVSQGAPLPRSAPVMYRPAVYTAPVEYPVAQAPAIRTIRASEAVSPQPVSARRVVDRAPRRNWKKTALVIGGTTATGAGIGGLIGGKKGALIGAAIGGGAGTLYEVNK